MRLIEIHLEWCPHTMLQAMNTVAVTPSHNIAMNLSSFRLDSNTYSCSPFVSHFTIFKSKTKIAYSTGTSSSVMNVATVSPPICA